MRERHGASGPRSSREPAELVAPNVSMLASVVDAVEGGARIIT